MSSSSTQTHKTHKAVFFSTEDHVLLAATYYQPKQSNGRSILINGATAVPRHYYHQFALYLTAQGFTVLTYDYRGIGDSSHGRMKDKAATFCDWGTQDTAAAITYLQASTPEHALLLIGHSAGGQLLGLAHNNQAISSTLLISCQNGYWGLWPAPRRWLLASFWYIGIPLLTALFGHVPARHLGLGSVDLPAGIARQWARWCRHPDYFIDETGRPLRPYFHTLKGPLCAYVIQDDWMAPRTAVDALIQLYPQANASIRTLSPRSPTQPLGHFGYFKKHNQALWSEAAQWLSQPLP